MPESRLARPDVMRIGEILEARHVAAADANHGGISLECPLQFVPGKLKFLSPHKLVEQPSRVIQVDRVTALGRVNASFLGVLIPYLLRPLDEEGVISGQILPGSQQILSD